MSKVEYKPKSHFFVDHANLTIPVPANLITDAFGPVSGSEATKYRTTSVIRSSVVSKVFAICDGHLFIQPQTGTDKINLILKPSQSYAPLKIKYFIYRGINKSDIIEGDNLKVVDPANTMAFLQRIWVDYINLNTTNGSAPPTVFPARLIGYDPENQLDESLISGYFFKKTDDLNISFEIPKCIKGEHIGNFVGEIGLDIVLDYGDYDLDYEEQLFKLDLKYARKKENIFDVTTVTGAVKQKRYREYIHQFIDAAAFWGSHIDCGEIRLFNESVPKTNATDIYNFIVVKYHTKNKIYLYIQGDRGRTFNFYGGYPSGNLSFAPDDPSSTPSLIQYKTNEWPIVIKNFNQSGASITNTIQVKIEYYVDTNILNNDLNFFAYTIRPGLLNTENFIYINDLIDPSDSTGHTQSRPIRALLNNIDDSGQKKSISSFIFIDYRGIQTLSDISCYNDLWRFNIKSIFTHSDDKSVFSAIYKGSLPNLYNILGVRCLKVQQKVLEDMGRDETGNIKKRKLFIIGFEDVHAQESKKYIRSKGFTSGVENLTDINFGNITYGDSDFKTFKGTFTNGSDNIKSLAIVNKKNYLLKQSFFQLGITDEEYNKLLYNTPSVPNVLPDLPHIPKDATNIYLYLEEDISISSSQSFRKFNLGVRFENDLGSIVAKFPSPVNKVEVYTIDGFFFFSKEYSEFQNICNNMSHIEAHFRPLSNWEGEYGFDWIRIGDSGHVGDSISPTDRRLIENIGHYYITSSPTIKDDDGNIFRGTSLFKKEKAEFNAFQSKYLFYPNHIGTTFYSVPFINLYPSKDNLGNSTIFPKVNLSGQPKCLVEADLQLLIKTNGATVSSMKIKYEKINFEITNVGGITPLPDIIIEGITYGCLQINNISGTSYPASINLKIKALNEFENIKKIQVIAVENGIELIAGELFIGSNSKRNRKELEVVLVDCKTNLTPNSSGSGFVDSYGLDTWHPTNPTDIYKNKIIDDLNKTLNQSLIDIKSITVENLDITRSVQPLLYSDFGASPQYTSGSFTFSYFTNNRIINPTTSEEEFLKRRLQSYISTNVTNKLLIICINEYCGTPNSSSFNMVNGESDITDQFVFLPKILMCKTGTYRSPFSVLNEANVLGHEATHSLGLFHYFSNSDYFTHRVFVSDNIMDYKDSSLSPLKIRISTNKYQWDKMRQSDIILDEI